MSASLLDVRGLTVELRRGDQSFTAVDHVSFAVRPGEVLGIVGESGAGKSVTGSAITDLLVPPLRRTKGEITLQGERVDALRGEGLRRLRGGRIGFIFQDPMTSLNPVLTVGRQLVDTIAAHLSLTRAEARMRAARWLERVGLPDPGACLDRYPHQLSGGMRQRVVIALALCAEPALVIADEPTTALDVSVQAHILKLLRELHTESGVAMILITHDLGVIAKMADRVAVLYAGRLVEIGPVSEILTRPRHPYTSGLMAATPAPSGSAIRFAPIPGAMPSLGAIPEGCAFHPRCARSSARCEALSPELDYTGETAHACYHPLDVQVPA